MSAASATVLRWCRSNSGHGGMERAPGTQASDGPPGLILCGCDRGRDPCSRAEWRLPDPSPESCLPKRRPVCCVSRGLPDLARSCRFDRPVEASLLTSPSSFARCERRINERTAFGVPDFSAVLLRQACSKTKMDPAAPLSDVKTMLRPSGDQAGCTL